MSIKEDLLRSAYEYAMAVGIAYDARDCGAQRIIIDACEAQLEESLEELKACATDYFNDVYDGAE